LLERVSDGTGKLGAIRGEGSSLPDPGPGAHHPNHDGGLPMIASLAVPSDLKPVHGTKQ